MKKILIIIEILLLTGCLGKTLKGYITKTCTKSENINGNTVETTINITSKQGNIETILIKETYDKKMNIETIKNSKKSEQNLYKTEPGIELNIEENTFLYRINLKEIRETIKTRFNIKEEQHKQINTYESLGYTCK